MQFLECLKALLKKYQMTYVELIGILGTDRTSVSRKVNGERKITKNEFEKMIRVMKISGEETQVLRKMFYIYQMGEYEYEEFICMKKYIESFNEEEKHVTIYQDLGFKNINGISNREQLNGVIFNILKNAVHKKCKVRIICQTQYKELLDMILHFSNTDYVIEHLICMDNTDYKSNNCYNIKSMQALNKIIIQNPNYKIKYFYEDVNSHFNSFSLFPFMVTTEECAVVFSNDFKTGLRICDKNNLKSLLYAFEKQYALANALFEVIEDDFHYLQKCMELEKTTFKKFFTFQYHPCVVLNGDEQIAEKIINKSFPYRTELLEMYKQRLQYFSKFKVTHFYTQEGIDDFLETGTTTDLTSEFFSEIPLIDRKILMNKLNKKDGNHENYIIDKSVVNIPKNLTIACYDNNNVLIGFNHPKYNNCKLVLKEHSVYTSIMSFFERLMSDETIKYL